MLHVAHISVCSARIIVLFRRAVNVVIFKLEVVCGPRHIIELGIKNNNSFLANYIQTFRRPVKRIFQEIIIIRNDILTSVVHIRNSVSKFPRIDNNL